jgi:hypothetical protein
MIDEAQGETSRVGVEMAVGGDADPKSGVRMSLSAPGKADPGLQLASPQNDLVNHWGMHPSGRTLGSNESKSGHGHFRQA